MEVAMPSGSLSLCAGVFQRKLQLLHHKHNTHAHGNNTWLHSSTFTARRGEKKPRRLLLRRTCSDSCLDRTVHDMLDAMRTLAIHVQAYGVARNEDDVIA
eukprot:765504-Hanusia_phi.AAC.12